MYCYGIRCKRETRTKIKCEECDRLLRPEFELMSHKNRYHGHPCEDCSLKFQSKAQLSHHKYRSHTSKIQLAKDDEDKDGEVSMKFDVKSDNPAKTEDETQGINDDNKI